MIIGKKYGTETVTTDSRQIFGAHCFAYLPLLLCRNEILNVHVE